MWGGSCLIPDRVHHHICLFYFGYIYIYIGGKLKGRVEVERGRRESRDETEAGVVRGLHHGGVLRRRGLGRRSRPPLFPLGELAFHLLD